MHDCSSVVNSKTVAAPLEISSMHQCLAYLFSSKPRKCSATGQRLAGTGMLSFTDGVESEAIASIRSSGLAA